jgi:membrane protein involved in colicin uptake
MGGKGGGGNEEPGWMPAYRAQQAKDKEAADKAAADKAASDKAAADQAAADQKAADKAAADQAAADKSAADKAASDQAAADKAAADKLAHTPLGNPIQAGGAITTPTSAGNAAGTEGLGNALGGSVLSPPSYWVGGANKTNPTGRSTGAIKTIQ